MRQGILLLLFLAPAVAHAQAAGGRLPAGVTDSMVVEGKRVYGGPGVCYACHGQDATGGMGPSLADTIWIHSKGEYDRIVVTILEGITAKDSKSGIMMPPRGGSAISDADARAVAAYVWSLSR
jgi:mono/diheme cytochrome c family protein